jgi:ribosomal protein S18 acetylase RimI-like enzyme
VTDAANLLIRPYADGDETEVVALWHRCNLVVPWNDPHRDIMLKRQFQPDLFLVGTAGGHVVAAVMAGYEGHRGWINYLAVSPDLQRRGLGRRMMAAAEAELRKLGCPKINLMVRSSNSDVVAFYARLGFAVEDRVSMGKRLE